MIINTIGRRQFLEVSGKGALGTAMLAATAAGGGVMLAGCPIFSNVFSDILNWVPVGEAAVDSVLAVLTANGVILPANLQTIIGLVKAGFTALTAAIKEYQSTTPPPVGALAKIQDAFKAVTDNFETFLASLSVSGGLLGIITGLAQIVFSTIAAFMNQLPASSAMRGVVIGSAIKVAGNRVAIVPKLRTRGRFKKDWNSILASAPPLGVTCPANAYLPLTFWEHF